MALVSNEGTRHEVPHEPGEWISLRSVTWREWTKSRAMDVEEYTAYILGLAIESWSYDAPVSAAAIDRLDPQTATWVAQEIARQVRGGDAGEAAAGVPTSSGTSSETPAGQEASSAA